jgi:hypothetical protein
VKTTLLAADGSTAARVLTPAPQYTRPTTPLASRIAYAAAHVVPKSWAENVPNAPANVDWDQTLGYRHHLWSWGLGVADAMDTAQRNMGLDAVATRELIRRTSIEARSAGGAVVVGVNTDQVEDEVISLDAVIAAYLEQLEFAEDQGAGVVLMASRHLARAATSGEDYERVYREVLSRAGAPVVLHWLGAAFDPVLTGYFGSADWTVASRTVLRIIGENASAVSGIKMSLLDASSEIAVRSELPSTATMFTGDDFNYVGLIEGSGDTYSNALLGAFAAIGPTASAAIQELDRGDVPGYRVILGPSEALSRHIFTAPTFYYKTGIAFLSWLNGHQSSFSMIGGLHSARSLVHLSEIVRLADEAGCLENPELAGARWDSMLRINGVER